jgi:hypothetical protein
LSEKQSIGCGTEVGIVTSASKLPKMGLRAANNDNKQQRPTTMYNNSEQSLPDRLTQALKGLSTSFRPITHSTSSSAPFNNKNHKVILAREYDRNLHNYFSNNNNIRLTMQ